MKERGYKEDCWNFYVVMNMMYSDYYNSKFGVNEYAELAKDWLDDEDISGNKLLKYYYFVAQDLK